jgi:hypothetical protein
MGCDRCIVSLIVDLGYCMLVYSEPHCASMHGPAWGSVRRGLSLHSSLSISYWRANNQLPSNQRKQRLASYPCQICLLIHFFSPFSIEFHHSLFNLIFFHRFSFILIDLHLILCDPSISIHCLSSLTVSHQPLSLSSTLHFVQSKSARFYYCPSP